MWSEGGHAHVVHREQYEVCVRVHRKMAVAMTT